MMPSQFLLRTFASLKKLNQPCQPESETEVVSSDIIESAENAVRVIKVSCIAALKNCPDEVMSKEYADSMKGVIFNEKLVLDTVHSSKYEHVSVRAFRSNQFVYTVSIPVNVKTSRLQESTGK